MQQKSIPLGYIDLPDGSKPIYPMNDIFLNHMFENTAYWDILRLTINIILSAYITQNPNTKAKPVSGEIKVRTQFQHLLNNKNTTRDQDFKIQDNSNEVTYVEFQNRARTNIPITLRTVEYFGLGIGHNQGRPAHQIWLLAEDVESVLHEAVFARYILKEEVNGREHPSTSGILYVSLAKLSNERTPAGELASVLLGRTESPNDTDVKKIFAAFRGGFDEFRNDKEVPHMLSLRERGWEEGIAEGIEQGITQGITQGANKLLELIKSGIDPDTALKMITNENKQQDA